VLRRTSRLVFGSGQPIEFVGQFLWYLDDAWHRFLGQSPRVVSSVNTSMSILMPLESSPHFFVCYFSCSRRGQYAAGLVNARRQGRIYLSDAAGRERRRRQTGKLR
jgi:hypothetical protein